MTDFRKDDIVKCVKPISDTSVVFNLDGNTQYVIERISHLGEAHWLRQVLLYGQI